jgi:hypothetical protein
MSVENILNQETVTIEIGHKYKVMRLVYWSTGSALVEPEVMAWHDKARAENRVDRYKPKARDERY